MRNEQILSRPNKSFKIILLSSILKFRFLKSSIFIFNSHSYGKNQKFLFSWPKTSRINSVIIYGSKRTLFFPRPDDFIPEYFSYFQSLSQKIFFKIKLNSFTWVCFMKNVFFFLKCKKFSNDCLWFIISVINLIIVIISFYSMRSFNGYIFNI